MKRAVRTRDVIELVDSFYRPPDEGGGLEEWAASLCAFIAPLMDDGLGVVTRLDRLHPPEKIAHCVHSPDEEFRRAVEALSDATSHEALRLYAPNQGLFRLSDVVGPLEGAFSQPVQDAAEGTKQRGVLDWAELSATDGTGYVVSLVAPMLQDELPGGSKVMWQMVSAHLAAAFRLQRRRIDLLSGIEGSAIVDATNGRVLHADGSAKENESIERIRAAIRAIDRARAQDGDDSELALSTWKGLVDGCWSVVDRHDHDGRRYVVAVPNDPDVGEPRGLTEREAQVASLASLGQHDKLIAYTLGLERSTIATHLRQALRKLGLRDRVELASVFTSTTLDARGE